MIGRGKDCDLRLGGSTVSRRHCIIRQEHDRVDIMDLDSRNGTVVNTKRLIKGQAASLWHGDELGIGAWRLQVSLVDRDSEIPVLRSPSKTDQLLDELDEFGAAMEAGNTTWHELGISDPEMTAYAVADEQDSVAEPNGKPRSRAADPTSSTNFDVPFETEDLPFKTETESAAADSQAEVSDADDAKSAPRKIPAHLRPKGPADSQDAADQALRRLFDRH